MAAKNLLFRRKPAEKPAAKIPEGRAQAQPEFTPETKNILQSIQNNLRPAEIFNIAENAAATNITANRKAVAAAASHLLKLGKNYEAGILAARIGETNIAAKFSAAFAKQGAFGKSALIAVQLGSALRREGKPGSKQALRHAEIMVRAAANPGLKLSVPELYNAGEALTALGGMKEIPKENYKRIASALMQKMAPLRQGNEFISAMHDTLKSEIKWAEQEKGFPERKAAKPPERRRAPAERRLKRAA